MLLKYFGYINVLLEKLKFKFTLITDVFHREEKSLKYPTKRICSTSESGKFGNGDFLLEQIIRDFIGIFWLIRKEIKIYSRWSNFCLSNKFSRKSNILVTKAHIWSTRRILSFHAFKLEMGSLAFSILSRFRVSQVFLQFKYFSRFLQGCNKNLYLNLEPRKNPMKTLNRQITFS